MQKRCSACHHVKEVVEFTEFPGTKKGYLSWCKSCESGGTSRAITDARIASEKAVRLAAGIDQRAIERQQAKERRREMREAERLLRESNNKGADRRTKPRPKGRGPVTPESNRLSLIETRARKYGISLDDFLQMATEQENKCAICGCYSIDNLAIDHCHETHVVRGLLCGFCNMMLGSAKDNIQTLRNAADYLEKYGKGYPFHPMSPE